MHIKNWSIGLKRLVYDALCCHITQVDETDNG